MNPSATNIFSESATDTEQVYFPQSFTETFVMCNEKLPLPPRSHCAVALLLEMPCISPPLNFHTIMESKASTKLPRQTKVTLKPRLVTMFLLTGLTFGVKQVAPEKKTQRYQNTAIIKAMQNLNYSRHSSTPKQTQTRAGRNSLVNDTAAKWVRMLYFEHIRAFELFVFEFIRRWRKSFFWTFWWPRSHGQHGLDRKTKQ